jgi:hypothetical protein
MDAMPSRSRVSTHLTACLAALLLGACAWPGPVRWELPDGYRGWVLLAYEHRGCPPLPLRGITQVIAIDAEGCGCTSSSLGTLREPEYAYVRTAGTVTMLDGASWIHARAGGTYFSYPNGSGFRTRRFFVGPPEEGPAAVEELRANPPDPEMPRRRCGIPLMD